MKVLIALSLTLVLAACDGKGSQDVDKSPTPWTVEVRIHDSTTTARLEVSPPGAESAFVPWVEGQQVAGGSTVRTPTAVRATVALPDGHVVTLNHSSEVELAEAGRIVLRRGQALVASTPGVAPAEPLHVQLPQGEAVLHGTKVAFVAGQTDSSVTVSQGLVEVRGANQSVEARAGQEVVLRADVAPSVTHTPELGRRLGWAELGERESIEALPEVPRGLGKLVGKVPGEGENEHKLELLQHDVDVKIQGNLAYTEVHEAFKNPVNKTLEGIYRFPLPPDARISRLSLKVGDKWMEGEFLDNDRAEEIWNDVKKPIKQVKQEQGRWVEQWVWRDPALLKWKEGNTFELRIFPIPAGEIREVKIGYVERLHPSANGYAYTYPMPVDRAGLIPAKRFEFNAELVGYDATQSLEMTGYEAEVATGATDADAAIATIKWAEDDFVARGDFAIRFGRRDAVGLRTATYAEEGKDPYAVFVIRPEFPVVAEAHPRDFVFVLDRSMSRTGTALEAQRQLVPRMIREMDPLDRVTVVACNERCVPVGVPDFQAPREESAQAVAAALQALTAKGATYPVEAMRVTAELFRRRTEGAREAHVIYFTDGVASVGELRPGRIADNVKAALGPFDARMSVVDVGGDVDSLVLEALAEGGRGRVVSLDPMVSLTGQALDLLNNHYRSLLTDPKLSLPPGVVAEGDLPRAIAAGDEMVIAARFPAAIDGEFAFTGTLQNEPYASRYPVHLKPSLARGNTFVPGEWATERIANLELQPDSSRADIVALSTTYGVLSRHTSLLALESDQMMAQYKVEKRERTQWSGEEAAEEVVTQEISSTRTKRSARKPRQASPPMPSSAPAMKGGLDDAFGGGGGFGRARPMPLPRAPRGGSVRVWVPDVPSAQVQDAKEPTKWELSNLERRQKASQSEPGNRTKRMAYIRAALRAGDLDVARREASAWFDVNPMDPEARVISAQLQARGGDLAAFYEQLLESLDAAPRGRWLQERVQRAAVAQSDEPLVCAMNVAMEATEKVEPKTPADNLACPMTTVIETWFGGAAGTPSTLPDGGKVGSGELVIELTSRADWDIMVLEPSGRPLWWGSARNGLQVSNVVGAGTERLSLPKMHNGTYSILAIPRAGAAGDSLQIEIRSSIGASKSLSVIAPGARPFEVAEVTRQMRPGDAPGQRRGRGFRDDVFVD